MGRYITEDDVKELTLGKVQFTEDAAEKNKMQITRLKTLISEAEAEVDLDLSLRYQTPITGPNDEKFSDLAKSTVTAGASQLIKTLCRLQSVMKILDTDYGRGSVVDASKYYETLKKRYDSIMFDRLVKKRKDVEDSDQWMYPPLPLKMAWFNTAADDGFRGTVLSFSHSGDGAYPAEQINDPSESFFNIWGQE